MSSLASSANVERMGAGDDPMGGAGLTNYDVLGPLEGMDLGSLLPEADRGGDVPFDRGW